MFVATTRFAISSAATHLSTVSATIVRLADYSSSTFHSFDSQGFVPMIFVAASVVDVFATLLSTASC